MKNESQTSKTPLKLLVIAPYCIVPADTGGKIRVSELVHGVSEHGISVTVVMPITPAQFSRRKINQNLTLEVVPYPFIFPFLFTDKPFSFFYLLSLHPGYFLFVKKFFKTFDIVQFEGASFGDLVDFIPPHKIVVYDAHNVEYDYVSSESRWQWVRNVTTKRIRKLEKKLAHRADRILTCSAGDAERLSQLYDIRDEKFTVIPNGIHLHKNTPRLTVDQVKKKFSGLFDFPRRAIFSGSDVEHNRKAVRFLIESVAPQLRRECAFIIQGQCGYRFRNNKSNNVFFDTSPGNIGTYADVCTIALNPVMQGSGTSLKVLDYLAHGLPVVSTAFGMRGFDDLKKYVILAELENFTNALLQKHCFDPKLYPELERYSWQFISKTLSETYHLLTKNNELLNE